MELLATLTGAMGTLVGAAMLPGLPLLAPVGNVCLTGVTSMQVGAARLAPLDVANTPFRTTRALELGWPEPLSTPEWLGSPNYILAWDVADIRSPG